MKAPGAICKTVKNCRSRLTRANVGAMRPLLLTLVLVFASPGLIAQDNSAPPVKKSHSGICHERGYGSYNQTKQFEPYDSMEACVASGGRRAENVPTPEERAREAASKGGSGWLKKGGF